MRRAVKIPLVLGGMLLSVIAAVLGLVVAAFFWPSLLINATSLRLISPLAATQGIYLQWDKAEVKATSAQTWIKSLDLHLRNLCLQAPAYNLSTCLPQVYAAVSVDVNPKHPRIISIGPTSLLGQRLSFGPVPPSSDDTPSTFDWTRIQRPAWLRDTVLKPTHIEWQQLSLEGPGWHVDGGAQLRIAAPAQDPRTPAGPPSVEAVLLLSPFCLREGPVALDGCVGRGEASVRVGVVNELFTLTQLGPVDITARSIGLRLPQGGGESTPTPDKINAPSPADTPDTASWAIPPVLQAARWQPMRVQIGAWQVHRGELSASGGLDLTLNQDAQSFLLAAKLGKVCADDGSAGLHTCFEQVNAEASAKLQGHTLSLDKLGPLQALGGELKLNPSSGISPPPATTAKAPPTLNFILDPTADLMPDWLERAHLAQVQVELNKIDFVSDDRHIRGALKVDGHSVGAGALWRLDLSGKGDGKGPLKTVSAELELSSGNSHFSGPWRMRADGKAVLTEGSDVTVHAHTSNPKPGVLAFEVNAKTTKDRQVATAKLDGQLDGHGVAARVDGSLLGMIPKIKRLTLDDCRIKLGWRHAWPDQGQLAMGCGLALQPEALPKQDEIPIEWPTSLHFKLKAEGRLPLPPSSPGKVLGEVHLDLDPITTRELALTSTTSAKINGTFDELPRSLNMVIDSTTQLAVPDFGAVVKSLGNSVYAIPAPLNVLRGRFAAQVKASGDLANGGIDVPILFTSRLKSGAASQNDEQRLDTDMGGTLHLDPLGEAPDPRLDFKALLSDVQLALPRITLADSKAPQVLPDARMRSTKAVRAEANAKGLLPSQHPDVLVGPPGAAAEIGLGLQRANPVTAKQSPAPSVKSGKVAYPYYCRHHCDQRSPS